MAVPKGQGDEPVATATQNNETGELAAEDDARETAVEDISGIPDLVDNGDIGPSLMFQVPDNNESG